MADHGRERTDERNRDGDERNERAAHRSEEQEHDHADDGYRLHERGRDLLERVLHVDGAVVGEPYLGLLR